MTKKSIFKTIGLLTLSVFARGIRLCPAAKADAEVLRKSDE